MASSTPPVARTSDSLVRTFILILLTNVEFTLTKSTPDSFKGTRYSTFQSSVTETNKSSAVEESTEKQSHPIFGRNLLQRRRESRAEGESSFNISCQTLTTSFYNASSHVWTLNREALEFINYDLQSIIDCTNEDDTLLFQTNQTIKPVRTLNISMSLTLSSRYHADNAGNDNNLTASEMVRFTCPDSGQLIKSSSPNLTLRGLMIEDCNSNVNIIELEPDCSVGRPEASITLLQLVIAGNNLSSPARIVDSKAPTCFRLEMEDVMIQQNNCSSESCVLLSSRNRLNNLELLDNTGATLRLVDPAIFLAIEGSNTIASNVKSERNKIKIFNISSSTLGISNSNFINNEARGNGGVIFAHSYSSLTFLRSYFSRNRSNFGVALYMDRSSIVNISDCSFMYNRAYTSGSVAYLRGGSMVILDSTILLNNNATYGGALYLEDSTNGDISHCNFENNIATSHGGAIYMYNTLTLTFHQSNFSTNRANFGGALYLGGSSIANISKCKFINHKAYTSGGVAYVGEGSIVTLESSRLFNNNAEHGGALYMHGSSNGIISNCNFINNMATSNGGAINTYVSSTLNLHQSNFSSNEARIGGALYLQDSSNGRILDCHFTNNKASSNGGAIYIYMNSTLYLHRSNLSSNEARYGGTLYIEESSNGNISNCNFTNNIATNNGGAINIYINSTLTLLRSIVSSNNASIGGALYLRDFGNGRILDCNFTNNKASSSGGAIYIYINSTLYLHQSNLSSNEARYGGSLYAEHFSNVTSTSTKFANNVASSSGGAIFIRNSTLAFDNTIVQSNKARKDCGGVCAIEVSKVSGSNLTIHGNAAKNVGGGIGIGNGSSILCYACNISKNNAFSGAGLHVSINDSILVVAQMQNSNFENNSVRSYGSGITFTTPMKRSNNCNSSNDTCGRIVLLNTNFEGNRASPNGVSIPTINTSGVLIDCEYKEGSAQDFLNQTILSFLEKYDPKKSCLQRKGDLLHMSDDGVIVGTLSQVITLSIAHDNDEVGLIWNAIDGYMLKNVSSGRQLPRVYITILNGFGGDLMFSLPNSFVARLYSSDRLFYGEYFTDSFIGSGHFSNATLFARPGNYSLEFRSNLSPIWAINVTVIVRECFVGEEPIEDPFTCQSCDALSYNFDASNISRCTPCPLDGSCKGRYIVPKKGHWHKSPCHNNTQKCIVEEACSLDDRTDVLMNFTTNFTNCSMNETELDAYNEKLCNKGYQGPLCGSCNQTFGLSSRFMCRECTSNILSLLVIIGVTLYLLGATVVTIRGCLPSNLTHRESHLETYQSLNVARPSEIDQQVNIQMAERNDEGNVPQEQLITNDTINISETETSKLQQETEFELTRWKITEIFKIMINFLQTTGVAASIDVPWTEEMNTMFATSDYIGALTTDAISRPVDCLVSSDSTSLKALWRMMVSVSIPLIVLGILTSFWGYITIKNGKGGQYFLKRFILSSISVAYISYLGLTKMAVRAFYCVDVYDSVDHLEQSTTKLWAVDTSIMCYEDDHAGIIVIAALVLLFVTFSYPLLSFIALIKNKENVRRDDKRIFEIASFLFRAFKEKFLFWESIVMLRKACLSVICVFSYSLGGDSQLLLVSVLLFFCLYLQLTLRPYREDFKILNHFESISLLVSGLTFSLGQFFIEGRCNDYIKTFLVVLLIFGNSMFFLLLLLALFYNSMVHLRVTLQCENIPLPVPPIWWNILKVYIHSRYTKWRQLHN